MFIDIHTHASRYKEKFTKVCTAEELIEEFDKYGIDKGVVQPMVSPEVYYPQSNEDILYICEKYPDRLIPFCNIDPRSGKNSPTTDFTPVLQYYKDRGCKGVGEVMPKMEIRDPKMQNLLYHCEKVGLSVTFDGSPQKDRGFGVYDDPGLPQLELTLMSFPELIVFAHGPLFWSELARLETIGERGYVYTIDDRHVGNMNRGPIREEGVLPKLMRKYPNLYGDLSDGTPTLMFNRDRDFAGRFMTEFQDRLYFGTDLFFKNMPVSIVDLLYEMRDAGQISNEVFEKIAYKNAEKFLGVKR